MDELAEGLRGMRGELGVLYRQVQLQHAREHVAGSRRALRLHPGVVLQRMEAGGVPLRHTEPLEAIPGDAISPNATADEGTAGTGATVRDFVPPAGAVRTQDTLPNGSAAPSTHRAMSARPPSPTRRY